MSIKVQDIIANEVLPLSQFSMIGTEDNPWNRLYGSFATFSFPTDTPANLDDYWSDSRIYAGDPLNFQGYVNGPADHVPTSGDLLIVLPRNGNALKQLLFTNNGTYQRNGAYRGTWGNWKKFSFEGDNVITLPYVPQASYIALSNDLIFEASSGRIPIATGLVVLEYEQMTSCAIIFLYTSGQIKVVECWNDTGLSLEGGVVYTDSSMTEGAFSLLIPPYATGHLIVLQESNKISFNKSNGILGHFGTEIPYYIKGNNVTILTSNNFNRWVPALDGSGAHSANGPWKIDTFGKVGVNQLYVDSRGTTESYYPIFTTPSGETRSLNTINTSNENGFSIAVSGSSIYIKNGSLNAKDVYVSGTSLQTRQLTIAGNSISLIGLPNEITANQLRQSLGLSNALHFIGTTASNITDGGTEIPQDIVGYTTPSPGDVVLYMGYEYLWTDKAKWEKLGPDASFKLKQSAVNTKNLTSSATGCNIFISDIQQDEHGEISATKKTIAPLTVGVSTKTYDGSIETNLNLSEIGAVAKTGDEMSGPLKVYNDNAPAFIIGRKNADDSYAQKITFGINSQNYGGLLLNKLDKWMIVADSDGNVSMNGNAESANKVNNALTINNRGKDIVFNGSAAKNLIINRRCTAGRFGSMSETNDSGGLIYAYYADEEKTQLKSWQKLASITLNSNYGDREIVFKVSRAISTHEASGILRAHIRSNGINKDTQLLNPISAQLDWEYANKDIALDDFIMIITPDESNKIFVCEIWMNFHNSSWLLYHFDVLQEHDRTATGDDNQWILYNRIGNKEEDWEYFDDSIFNSSNVLKSELLDIKNNAATATTLTDLTASITELNYLSGATSNIQTQLNNLNTSLSGYLPLIGGIVTGTTTFRGDIEKTTSNAQPAGKWSSNNSASTLQIGDYSGGLPGYLKLCTGSLNNYIQLIPENVTTGSGGNTYNLTLPQRAQMLIGTAGNSSLAGSFIPAANKQIDLGSSSYPWANIYATTLHGALEGNATSADKVNNTLKIYQLDENGASNTTIFKEYDGSASKDLSLTTLVGSVTKLKKYIGYAGGSTTKPVYFADGVLSECNAYAGGTAITLNGTSKAASTASFYAPTSAGTSGQYLKSNGSGAPTWATTSVSNTWTEGTTSGPTLTTTVNGKAGSAVAIPSASATASGIITTGTQTFVGTKTFSNNVIKVQGSSDNALALWAYKSGESNMYGLGVNGSEGTVNYLWLSHNATKNLTQFYTPLVLKDDEKAYGTNDPGDVITTPVKGQIYFKLVD